MSDSRPSCPLVVCGLRLPNFFRVNNMKRHDCQARQYGDQMMRPRAGSLWTRMTRSRRSAARTSRGHLRGRQDCRSKPPQTRGAKAGHTPDEVAEMVKTTRRTPGTDLKRQIWHASCVPLIFRQGGTVKMIAVLAGPAGLLGLLAADWFRRPASRTGTLIGRAGQGGPLARLQWDVSTNAKRPSAGNVEPYGVRAALVNESLNCCNQSP